MGLYFSSSVIFQYQEGITTFAVTQDPITLKDIPAISFCSFFSDMHLAEMIEANLSSPNDIPYVMTYNASINRNRISRRYVNCEDCWKDYERDGVQDLTTSRDQMVQLVPMTVDDSAWCLSVHFGNDSKAKFTDETNGAPSHTSALS